MKRFIVALLCVAAFAAIAVAERGPAAACGRIARGDAVRALHSRQCACADQRRKRALSELGDRAMHRDQSD